MDITDWVKDHSWILAPAFVATLAFIIWLKSRFANRVEIKPVDVGIALIPFLLWMATAGIFKKVEVPGIVSLETADVIVDAAAAPIDLQVTKMPVSALKSDAKEGVFEIPHLIASGTQALSFRLGYGGYNGPAIWMYFNNLARSPAFKYAVITKENGSLFGLFEASKLTASMNPDNNESLMTKFPLDPFSGLPENDRVQKWTDFANAIRQSKTDKLSSYPGFVSLDMSVKPDEDKQRALSRMEKLGLEWLPVVKDDNDIMRFQGIVERSRLTASLILDVASQLQSKKKEQEN